MPSATLKITIYEVTVYMLKLIYSNVSVGDVNVLLWAKSPNILFVSDCVGFFEVSLMKFIKTLDKYFPFAWFQITVQFSKILMLGKH